MLLPEFEGAGREFCIGLIRPVSATNDTGFATGRGTGISRAPRVEEGDFGSAAEKVKGGPTAESARADYRDMAFALHGDLELIINLNLNLNLNLGLDMGPVRECFVNKSFAYAQTI